VAVIAAWYAIVSTGRYPRSLLGFVSKGWRAGTTASWAMAVQDLLQPDRRVPYRPVAGTVAGHHRAGVPEQVLGVSGQRPAVDGVMICRDT
jgi:hypothetical protein